MRGLVSLVLASAVAILGCNTGPNIDHYVGVLDALAIPADWELVETQRRGPGEAFDCDPLITSTCPGADRWYALSGDVLPAVEKGSGMLEAAGYTVEPPSPPECDAPPSGSACTVRATRGADRVSLSIFPPGRSTGLDSPPEADVIIKVTAQR